MTGDKTERSKHIVEDLSDGSVGHSTCASAVKVHLGDRVEDRLKLLELLVTNVTKGVVLRHWIAFAIVYFGIDDFLELILVVAGVTACAGIARVCGRARWQVGLVG